MKLKNGILIILMRRDGRKLMCQYCEPRSYNDFVPMNQTVEYSGIELAINCQGMLRARCYNVDEDVFETQDIVEIKYCPLCGRKFSK